MNSSRAKVVLITRQELPYLYNLLHLIQICRTTKLFKTPYHLPHHFVRHMRGTQRYVQCTAFETYLSRHPWVKGKCIVMGFVKKLAKQGGGGGVESKHVSITT